MAKVRWMGTYTVEVSGRRVQPGEEIDVPDDVAADLCREGRFFDLVQETAASARGDDT